MTTHGIAVGVPAGEVRLAAVRLLLQRTSVGRSFVKAVGREPSLSAMTAMGFSSCWYEF